MYPTQVNSNRKKVKKLPVFEDEKNLAKFLETNFTESLKQMIKMLIKTMVKEEMETFRKEFEEKLYFNGHYERNMISTFGKVEGIPIPRFRQTPDNLNLSSLNVFEGEYQNFAKVVEQMHLLGISQRKISHIAKTCFSIPLSKDKTGAIFRELAEKEEFNLNNQIITDDYEYLYLDGIWEKTKGYGWDDNKSVLLCVLGVKATGERKIIGFKLARAEDHESWEELLLSIKKRGLKGSNLKLIIMDDSGGLKKALETHLPTVLIQNCVVHKMRNVLRKTSFKNRPLVTEDVKNIFNSINKEEAITKAQSIVKKWYMTEQKAMESLRHNVEYCFTYMDFPQEVWSKIRTTNILEREFREVRRRMKGFDSTFQNPQSANRYANSIINYLNENYPLSSRALHTKA